jgi:hypothetical protein
MNVWINPEKAKMPKQEQDEWVALMATHHPEIDWKTLMEELNEANNVKRTGRKSKED